MTTCAALLLSLSSTAAKDCTATAEYPDGSVVERECIIEGEGGSSKKRDRPKSKGVTDEMSWLKDTRWLWNEWREVIFRADGSFLAPAENCERPGNPKCTWSADDDKVYVHFGGAGLHTLTCTPDQQTMSGARDSDGDAVSAQRV